MAENFIEMELREIHRVENPAMMQQIIVLEEKEPAGPKGVARSMPIFIGLAEAKATENAVKQVPSPRPLTHDLILNVIDEMGGSLERVLVVRLESDTFYGALEVKAGTGELVRVDARPSDAIVVATRRQVPIFVEEAVLSKVWGNRPDADEDVDDEDDAEDEDDDQELEEDEEDLEGEDQP